MVALSNEDVETLNRYAKYQRLAAIGVAFRVNILLAIIGKAQGFVQLLIRMSARCPCGMPRRPYDDFRFLYSRTHSFEDFHIRFGHDQSGAGRHAERERVRVGFEVSLALTRWR